MNLWLPQFRVRHLLDRFLPQVRGTWIDHYVSHRAQLPLAADLLQVAKRGPLETRVAHSFAEALLACPMQGAGYAWESRRWLQAAAGEATDLDCTGANALNYNVLDFFGVSWVGLVWTTTGTTTKLVLDFDLYPQPNGGGSLSADKLDGTNGVITAPTTASQAAGNVLYKDLGATLDVIAISPGYSIKANVTTTVTAGHGLPIILGFVRAETYANLSTATASS